MPPLCTIHICTHDNVTMIGEKGLHVCMKCQIFLPFFNRLNEEGTILITRKWVITSYGGWAKPQAFQNVPEPPLLLLLYSIHYYTWILNSSWAMIWNDFFSFTALFTAVSRLLTTPGFVTNNYLLRAASRTFFVELLIKSGSNADACPWKHVLYIL